MQDVIDAVRATGCSSGELKFVERNAYRSVGPAWAYFMVGDTRVRLQKVYVFPRAIQISYYTETMGDKDTANAE